MDRNLGAPNSNHLEYSGHSSKGNVHYQFGRKDPFPSASQLFNIDGVLLSGTAPADFQAQRWDYNANGVAGDPQVKVSESVYDSMKFYRGGSSGNWASNVDGSGRSNSNAYVWHDPKIPATIVSTSVALYSGKSIYDPCPPGWKLPTSYAWEDFRRNDTYGHTVSSISVAFRDFPAYFSGSTTVNWMHYWPNVETGGEYPVDGRIFYSISSNYREHDATAAGTPYMGSYWSAISSPVTIGYGYCTQFATAYTTSSPGINAQRGLGKVNALSIRCVSMSE